MDSPKVVEVRWLDSGAIGMWSAKERYNSLRSLECLTVGYLFKDLKDRLIIHQSYELDEGDVMHTLQIPKVAVISMKVLRK